MANDFFGIVRAIASGVLLLSSLGCSDSESSGTRGSGDDAEPGGSSADAGESPAAAGSGGRAGENATGGDTSVGSSNSGTGGNAPAGGASAGAGGSADPLPSKTGQVAFFEYVFSANTRSLSASFRDFAPPPTECAVLHSAAGCTVRDCPATGSDEPREVLPHAGVITYESPDVGGILRIEPDEFGTYGETEDTRTEQYAGAVRGTFRATGGDVPAFEADLDFPLRVVMDEPVAPDGRIEVSRDEDLTLRWSRGELGMKVALSARETTDTGTRFLSCTFDAEVGEATIPKALLQDAPAASSVAVLAYATTTIEAGEYSVVLASGDMVVNPDRTLPIYLVIP